MSPNGTTFSFAPAGKGPLAGEVVLIPLIAKPQPPMELVTRVDRLCGDAVSDLLAVRPLRDEVGHLMHTTSGGTCRRVLVVGLGELKKAGPHELRRAAATAARWIIGERLTKATLWIDGLMATGVESAAAEWASGMALAGFRFAEFKQPEPQDEMPDKVQVVVRASESGHVERLLPEIRAALTIADAVNYTRRLAHQPANVINPKTLAAEARKLAGAARLKYKVLGPEQLRALGMNGLLAVGQGAAEPACLIQLEYRGARAARTLTVLVGKAITFDTGGYSIKPAQGLEELKFD
ncbi:MAG: M17 family peptidase N-terminal domain-containing protein, partial [Planctomycetota bacterium]